MVTVSIAGLLALTLLSTAPPPDAGPSAAPVETRLSWLRGPEGTIKVDANTSGPRLAEAQRELQALASRMDALRTTEAHVVWRSLVWHDGRLMMRADAQTSVYGSVALMACRDLFPGRRTAGSGVQQVTGASTAKNPFPWLVKLVMAAPRTPKPATDAKP